MRIPGPAYAVASMISIQMSTALSTHLFGALSPAGATWLRLSLAAVVFIAIGRPRIADVGWPTIRAALALGAVTAVLMLAFIEAVARIPLGTASALEFLGPLGVAVTRRPSRRALLWPAFGLVGVLALTEPWRGRVDLVGVGFALAAAAAWALYILLTQHVGARLPGVQGLAISFTTATIVAAPFAVGSVVHGLTVRTFVEAALLTVLGPLLPYALELPALRRMQVGAFGTLMALEPGIATMVGVVLLGQLPTAAQAVGIALVVTAGVGAQWRGHDLAADALPPPGDPLVSGAWSGQ